MYLLDTDHLSILQWQTMPDCQTLSQRLLSCSARSLYTSIVSFHEEVRGWNRYINAAKRTSDVVNAYARFDKILQDFSAMQVLPFDDAAAQLYDNLKQHRIRIATMDLRIASIALAQRFTLLTRNFVDFARVPGLAIEDWTIPPSATRP